MNERTLPSADCDLVLKGGLTSGVVYPKAVSEISRTYRLRSIGGTSAGAIAAVMAAAAEYRRQSSANHDDRSGFAAIDALAEELGTTMRSLFQPEPVLNPLFQLLLAVPGPDGVARIRRIALGLIRGFPLSSSLGMFALLAGIFIAAINSPREGLLIALLSGIVASGLIAYRLVHLVRRELPRNGFGICSGMPNGRSKSPALNEWVTDRIDEIAGLKKPDEPGGRPLTIGDLERAGIEIATMTTDLSSGRPFQFPLGSRELFFRRSEFEALFPGRIVDHLIASSVAIEPADPTAPDDLYHLNVGHCFPVVLCARVSLSFPGLISAIPVWRHDNTASGNPIRRCWLSDGGIASNFPISFFDNLLPRRPTLGISLVSLLPDDSRSDRIRFDQDRKTGMSLPVRSLDGIGPFLMAVLDTAKDWQDSLQSRLPGHADRIVEIRLDPKSEGGLNLSMSEDTIARLSSYGEKAGKALATFDFDENRWKRALTVLPKVEEALQNLASTLDDPPDGAPNAPTYAEVLSTTKVRSYKENSSAWRQNTLLELARRLAAIGRDALSSRDQTGRSALQQGIIPQGVDAEIRLVANADRRSSSGVLAGSTPVPPPR